MRFRTSGIWISLLVWQIAGPIQAQLPADVTASPTLVRIDCLQSGCHDSLNQQAFLHPPSMQGDCTICHIPAGIPINLDEKGHGLQTARPDAALCGRCHTSISLDRPVVHEPVRELCTTCHNPHGGSARYFLTKDSTGDLCLSCHATVVENLPHLHGPVAMKECQQCHSPHTSDFTGLLSRRPDRLCVYCHFTFQKEIDTAPSVHTPVRGECTGCHTPHGGTPGFLAANSDQELCARCHEATLDQMKTSRYSHSAMIKGKNCTDCHTPHWAEFTPLLNNSSMDICLRCHNADVTTEDGRVLEAVGPRIESSEFKHGPIQQKDCTPCHAAHGSEDPRLMKAPFPQDFYTDYRDGAYSLCFKCHDSRLVTEAETNATGFRNGSRNLHYEHVHRDKGRSCRACHHEHASSTRFQIRESVRFGEWNMQLRFKFTETGGTCLAGCHRPKAYDRVTPVDNDPLLQEKNR